MRAVAILALGLLLAGCAAEAPVPAPVPTVETSASPSPSPSATVPSSAPLVKPLLDELVISPDGLGPVQIAKPYAPRDPATDVLVWDETFCGFEDEPGGLSSGPADYGNWKNTYQDALTQPFLAEVAYGRTAEDPVMMITTFSELLRTESGLGIGSTAAELQAAYGADLITSPEDYYYPAVVHGRSGQLVFWFSYESPGVVYMLQVIAGFDTPQWSFHMTACL